MVKVESLSVPSIVLSFHSSSFIIILLLSFATAVTGGLSVKGTCKETLTQLTEELFHDPLSFSLAAQPITSKLDESWWAYKDVVQGSFVPGNRHLSHNMLS